MKNHVQRRKKIQHVSKPKSYIDVGKLQDNVYKVISAKTVLHRKKILDTKEFLEGDESISNESVSDTEEDILR